MPRAWLLLLIVFAATGCGNSYRHYGGEYPKNLPRIVISLSPSATEIIAFDGHPGQLHGRTEACNFPINISQTVPVYGGVKPNYEKLMRAKPDVVVYDAKLYSPADISKLEETIGKNKLFGFNANTIDDFEFQLRKLGVMIASPMPISKYIDKIDRERSTAKSMSPAVHPKMAVMTGTLAAGTKSFLADVMRSVGAEPVGPDADRFVQMDPETLIQANPDIVVLAADLNRLTDLTARRKVAAAAQAAFLADPRYRSIGAAVKQRVFVMDGDILLRQGSRVDTLIQNFAKVVQSSVPR